MISQDNAGKTKTMARRGVGLAAALALVLGIVAGLLGPVLTGCSPRSQTFTDGVGRTIELEQIPERLGSISPAHTEILFALGLGDKVVCVSNWCNRPEQALQKEKVGDAFSIDKEKLVALKPDLVFVPGTADSQQGKEIEDLGIPVYLSSPGSIGEALEDIRRVAKITGVEEQGRQLAEQMEQELDDLSAEIEALGSPKPSVLVVLDQDLWTVGPGSFMDDVLSHAGGVNVVQDVDMQYLQISMEDVLDKDPDVILVTIPEEFIAGLKSRPGWSDLRAVKEGKVYFVDGDLTSRQGPSIVDGVKEIARHLCPELAGQESGS